MEPIAITDPADPRVAPFVHLREKDLVGDDVLRLQYLNEIEAEVEAVQIASDFGKEVFAYVVRAMNAAPGGSPT